MDVDAEASSEDLVFAHMWCLWLCCQGKGGGKKGGGGQKKGPGSLADIPKPPEPWKDPEVIMENLLLVESFRRKVGRSVLKQTHPCCRAISFMASLERILQKVSVPCRTSQNFLTPGQSMKNLPSSADVRDPIPALTQPSPSSLSTAWQVTNWICSSSELIACSLLFSDPHENRHTQPPSATFGLIFRSCSVITTVLLMDSQLAYHALTLLLLPKPVTPKTQKLRPPFLQDMQPELSENLRQGLLTFVSHGIKLVCIATAGLQQDSLASFCLPLAH